MHVIKLDAAHIQRCFPSFIDTILALGCLYIAKWVFLFICEKEFDKKLLFFLLKLVIKAIFLILKPKF